MKSRTFLLVAFVAIASLATEACNVTPKQAGEATSEACKLVEAFTDNAVVESICASAPELAEFAAYVAASRTDAGESPRMAKRCQLIPSTATCATNAETLAAIRALKAKRSP